MNSDFEKKLTDQPMRELPSEWRKEILGAAQAASVPARPQAEGFFSVLHRQIHSLLWPYRRGWAALATVWLLVFILNVSTDEKPQMVAKNSPAPDWIAALREQQRLMAELTRPADRAEAQQPKKVTPSPRSHLRKEEELAFV